MKPFIEYLVEDNDTLDYAVLLESILDEVPPTHAGDHPELKKTVSGMGLTRMKYVNPEHKIETNIIPAEDTDDDVYDIDVGVNRNYSNTGSTTPVDNSHIIRIARDHVHDFITKNKPKVMRYTTPDPKRHMLYQLIARQYPGVEFINTENTLDDDKKISRTKNILSKGSADVAISKLNSTESTKDFNPTHSAAEHPNPAVALAALAHKAADNSTTHRAAMHEDPDVVMAALAHKAADKDTASIAAQHRDPKVAMAALDHKDADSRTTNYAARHRDPAVVMAALNHKEADNVTAYNAVRHPDSAVAMAALASKPANSGAASFGALHPDPAVAMAALAHKSSNVHTTHYGAEHPNPKVALAALAHKEADFGTTHIAAKHPDYEVAMAAVNHKHADPLTIRIAASNPDPAVAAAAINHRYTYHDTLRIASSHPNRAVSLAAEQKLKDLRSDTISESYSAVKIKPFIRFLKEEDLTLEYHDTLNPKIWDGDQLKPEVQAKLMQIAKKWATFAKIPDFAVTDIILVGGNANYNWTKFSDLDLHVVVNREDLADCPDLLDDYLQNKKQLWALVHDITIYGHDVELYAQDKETPYPKKQGVYSVKDKKWIAQPKHENVDFRGPALLAKVKQYTERIDTLISTNAEDESFSKLKEKFKNMRSSGLKKIGEFSMENLLFKELRNRGVIDRMTKYLQSRLDQKLSLNENYPFQIQIHNKKTNELVGVKQLNSETKDTAMPVGLRALQLTKREFQGKVEDHQFSIRYPHDTSWITPTS